MESNSSRMPSDLTEGKQFGSEICGPLNRKAGLLYIKKLRFV
jgi:hypothetical protein